MRLCELCSATRTGFASIRNQPDFIDALFAAAAGKKVCISDSYKKKLYTGKEEFSTKLKEEWRKIDNLDSLTSFFDSMAEGTEHSFARRQLLFLYVLGPAFYSFDAGLHRDHLFGRAVY